MEIIGHQKQWQFLKKSVKMHRIPHAYLFSGQSQLGKKTISLEFIKLLFCQRKNEEPYQPCQTCQSCQYLKKGIHPDFFLVEPQKPTSAKALVGKREIKISQIRELSWKLSLHSSISPFKAALINEAHSLNSEAQNCFLKTLEEPKGKTILILITEYPETLFPTILSRIQKIRFFPVPKSEIENYLRKQGLALKEAQRIVSLSFGKPGLAIDFFLNPQKLKNQDQRIKEIIKISESDLSFRFHYAKNLISQKQNVKEILDIWLRHFRGMLLAKIQTSSEIRHYSLTQLKKILQVIERINFLIATTNVNPRLALETLMLQL